MLDRTTPPPIQPMTFTFRRPVERVLPGGIPIYIVNGQRSTVDSQQTTDNSQQSTANSQPITHNSPLTTLPGVLRIDLVFSAGQWHQVRKLQALFACRMLREGCEGYTAAQFAERLDYYGAWLELSVAMNRTFVTLYTLRKHFDHTIALLHTMVSSPTYEEEQLHTVCANNKAQLLVNLQKGDVIAMRSLRRSIYGDTHPCGMATEPEDYDTLQTAHLKEFYARYYSAGNCQIYLSGDVDEHVVSRVEDLFGQQSRLVPANGCKLADTRSERNRGSATELLTDNGQQPTDNRKQLPESGQLPTHNSEFIIQNLPSAVQDSIRMGCLLMDVDDEDYAPMRVLTTVLGGYFGSRLMKNVRETLGYTYHIGADLVTNTRQALLVIHCEAQAGKAREVIDEVHREIRRLQTEPVPEEEMRMVRNYMTGEICRNYESAFALTDAYIFMEHLGLPASHLDRVLEAINTTSPRRLMQLAQHYLRPELMHTVVVSGEQSVQCAQ